MALLSPGTQVDVNNEKIYLPSGSLNTIPLFFIATKYGKTVGDTNAIAQGTVEAGVPRLITTLRESLTMYGLPIFYRDIYNQPQHGDARNEYGLLALNQYLKLGNRAYVIRADIDIDDSTETIYQQYMEVYPLAVSRAVQLLKNKIADRNVNITLDPSRTPRFGGWVERPQELLDATTGNPISFQDTTNAGWQNAYPSTYNTLDGHVMGNTATPPSTYKEVWAQYYTDLEMYLSENDTLSRIIDSAMLIVSNAPGLKDFYSTPALAKYNFANIVAGNYSLIKSASSTDASGRPIIAYNEYTDVSSGASDPFTGTTDIRYTNMLARNARAEVYAITDPTTGLGMATGTNIKPDATKTNSTNIFAGIKGKIISKMVKKYVDKTGVVVTNATAPYIKGINAAEFKTELEAAFQEYLTTESFYWASKNPEGVNTSSFGASVNNDTLRRMAIVQKLAEVIQDNSNTSPDYEPKFSTSNIASVGYEFNVVLCPGFPELVDEMITFAETARQEVFVIGDVPMNLSPRDVIRWGKLVDQSSVVSVSNNIRSDNRGLHAYYYPHALMNNLDGYEVLCPASALALAAFTYNDNNSYPWYAPAGPNRGIVSGITDVKSVGYVSGTIGTVNAEYIPVVLSPQLADSLYSLCNINPIMNSLQYGVTVWGQKTRTDIDFTLALSRINVSRLVSTIRRGIRKGMNRYLMENNDATLRKDATAWTTNYLHDIQMKRGIYDFAVQCDDSNNAGDTIDANTLNLALAIKPSRAIEFIYVSINLTRTDDALTF